MSHAIDNQSEPLAGDFQDLSFTRIAAGAARRRSTFVRQFDSSGDRGDADFDQRHNFVFYGAFSFPTMRRMGSLTQDWRIGVVGSVRSGLPFSILGGSADRSPLIFNRANLTGLPPTLDVPVEGGRRLLNRVAFASAGAVLGNTGRNAFAGPGFFGTDMSLSRGFRLRWAGESGRLTVRADAYNILNHANLGNPDSTLGDNFGVATYGRQEQATGFPLIFPLVETARQIQLMLRFDF